MDPKGLPRNSSPKQFPRAPQNRETLALLVAQYGPQLISLEADLKIQARRGNTPKALLKNRMAKLVAVQKQFRKLQQFAAVESNSHVTGLDIGLPRLEDCSSDELQICARFLQIKHAEIATLHKNLTAVFQWVSDAMMAKNTGIAGTLRLSKLRKMIHDFDLSRSTCEVQNKALDQRIEKMLAGNHPSSFTSASSPTSVIDRLSSLFGKIDAQISRIARIKQDLKDSEIRIYKMRMWLENEQKRIKLDESSQPLPLSLLTQDQGYTPRIKKRIDQALRRRDLAINFWDQMIPK